MRIFVTIILAALPIAGMAQLADDEFCENLATFEDLSNSEHESLELWSENYIDAIFASRPQSARISDAMSENWLRHQVATHIADCYMTGRGTERNIRKAMAVLEAPANVGHNNSVHMLASLQVFQSNDPELQREGFLTLQQEAEAGSAYSAGKVGWAYALGQGIEKNEQHALEHYFIAANAGMTYWQFLLAHAYEQGYYGLPVDPDQAKYWLEFEPKVHVAKYEREVAGDYERGIFPANDELQKQYRDACIKHEIAN
jgi:hypothetical protein